MWTGAAVPLQLPSVFFGVRSVLPSIRAKLVGDWRITTLDVQLTAFGIRYAGFVPLLDRELGNRRAGSRLDCGWPLVGAPPLRARLPAADATSPRLHASCVASLQQQCAYVRRSSCHGAGDRREQRGCLAPSSHSSLALAEWRTSSPARRFIVAVSLRSMIWYSTTDVADLPTQVGLPSRSPCRAPRRLPVLA